MRPTIQKLIWGLVLFALVAAGVLALIPKALTVETATVRKGPLEVTIREDGKTRIREKYIISAPVAGRLSRIELDPGDAIEGDSQAIAVILPAEPAMLDARTKAQAEARVEQAQAALFRARSQLEQVQVDLDLNETNFQRIKELFEKKAITPTQFEQAQARFLSSRQAVRTTEFDGQVAEFELKMARAAVNQYNESSIEPFEVSAPISGRVLRVFRESASVVDVGTPLVELGDPSNLEIEIDVLSTDAVQIPPYAELTIEHWGGSSPLTGRVRVVEPAAFTKISSLGVEEQRVNVIADFTESHGRLERLGDGYRVEAKIRIAQADEVLQIPNSSLFRHQRQWHVFVLADGRARLTPVEIGLQNETVTEILSGLESGQEVVVYPSDQIGDGVRIRPAAATVSQLN